MFFWLHLFTSYQELRSSTFSMSKILRSRSSFLTSQFRFVRATSSSKSPDLIRSVFRDDVCLHYHSDDAARWRIGLHTCVPDICACGQHMRTARSCSSRTSMHSRHLMSHAASSRWPPILTGHNLTRSTRTQHTHTHTSLAQEGTRSRSPPAHSLPLLVPLATLHSTLTLVQQSTSSFTFALPPIGR